MGVPFPIVWPSAAKTGVDRILAELMEASGSLTAKEMSLLAAIQKRLTLIEATEGALAAVAAAEKVRRIWLQALADDGAASEAVVIHGRGVARAN